jgi:hypothetical protein
LRDLKRPIVQIGLPGDGDDGERGRRILVDRWLSR